MKPYYRGKVRNMYDIGNKTILMEATDRLSAFNVHQCDVPLKGVYLNQMSTFWLNKTKHIINNHYIWSEGRYMVVQKTQPIKLEIIVRGYITGSLWRAYEKGGRNMYGLEFSDGLQKDQAFDQPIITPTTKDDDDLPIIEKEIVTNYLSSEDWNFIKQKSLELFQFGTQESAKMGLTLVDTKYEFGRDLNGNIILIDEVHTCDSSRYWYKDQSLDKEIARKWLLEHPNEKLPHELIKKVQEAYKNYNQLMGCDGEIHDVSLSQCMEHFRSYFNNFICIVAGSTSDRDHVEKICFELRKYGMNYDVLYASAHKAPHKVLNYIKKQESYNRSMVWITVAGMSNALSGVVAANTKYPVFACPPFSDKTDMMVNINSTLQMPSNVPVATILKPGNLAMFINKMYSL
jgi:fusion protein PurCD